MLKIETVLRIKNVKKLRFVLKNVMDGYNIIQNKEVAYVNENGNGKFLLF